MRTAWLTLAIAAAMATSHAAIGNPLEQPWYEYRSANFTVISDQDEARVSAAIESLELFRAFVFKVTNAPVGRDVVPVDFYLFDNTGDFQATIKLPNVLGYMRPGLRRQNMVASSGVIGLDAQHVIFHEYVHYLLRNGGTTALHPKWYDEGLAEVLAATRFDKERNKVVLGGDIAERIAALRAGIHVSLSDIVSSNDIATWHPNHVAIFYSKSFALVNYLHVSRLVGNDRYPQMNEYLRLYRQGVDSTAAFEQAFGMPVSAMERELGQFLSRPQRPVLELPMDRFVRDGSYIRRPIPPAELAYRMGYLMVVANPTGARALFELDGRSHTDARFRAGVAVSYQMQRQFQRAADEMNAALEMAPDDPVVLQEAADLRSNWCRAEKPPAHCDSLRAEAKSSVPAFACDRARPIGGASRIRGTAARPRRSRECDYASRARLCRSAMVCRHRGRTRDRAPTVGRRRRRATTAAPLARLDRIRQFVGRAYPGGVEERGNRSRKKKPAARTDGSRRRVIAVR